MTKYSETTTAGALPTVNPMLDRQGIIDIQQTVRKVLIGRSVAACKRAAT